MAPSSEWRNDFKEIRRASGQRVLQFALFAWQLTLDTIFGALIFGAFLLFNWILKLVRPWGFVKPEHLQSYEIAHFRANLGLSGIVCLGWLMRTGRALYRNIEYGFRKPLVSFLLSTQDLIFEDTLVGASILGAFLFFAWIVGIARISGHINSDESEWYELLYFWSNWSAFVMVLCAGLIRGFRRLWK